LGGLDIAKKDRTKVDLKKTGCVEANLIRLAQNRVQWQALVNKVMNIRVS